MIEWFLAAVGWAGALWLLPDALSCRRAGMGTGICMAVWALVAVYSTVALLFTAAGVLG